MLMRHSGGISSGRLDDGRRYDVAVLGSGLVAGIIGSCLARNGARVVILDEGAHPRFSIGDGESTPLFTLMALRLLGHRYGVPEIKYLAGFEASQAKVSSSGGICKNFGYVYHRERSEQDRRQAHMIRPPWMGYTPHHIYHQDTDAWMTTVAVRYGATVRQRQRITDVRIDEDGATIAREGADPVLARFVVDAAGARSVLAERFGLRQTPCRFRVNSRSLHTHMMGVRPYDELAPQRKYHHPSPWHQGSLHHMFPGGWMWVYPFDNHPRATNPLCSVGLQLDPRVHPVPDCSPEEEFRRFVARFPDLAPQFAEARAAQQWVRTDRAQYSSERTVGYRWALTSNTAGYVDPLFSGNLTASLESANVLLRRVLDALRDDDFSVERFGVVEDTTQGLLDFNDDLVANAYVSFRDFALWDVVYRLWSVKNVMSTYEINRLYARYLKTGDPYEAEYLEHPWWRGRELPRNAAYPDAMKFLQAANERIQAVERGGADPVGTAAELMGGLERSAMVPPIFGMSTPGFQWTDLPSSKLTETIRWTKKTAPKDVGELTFEGLVHFMRVRMAKGENHIGAEIKHFAAGLPVVGRRLRVPTPS